MKKNGGSLKEVFEEALNYYNKKDFKTSEIYCYKILSIDPNHFGSMSMLATLSAMKGDFAKAKELLSKGIEIEPNNVPAIHNLATAYKELGKFDEAINYYNKVLKIVPQHINSHYNLGLTFYKLNDLQKAKSYFKRTVEIQKNYALAFFWLANVHADLKEYNDAVSNYQKAIEINSNLPNAHNNLGLVFSALNDHQNAINSYKNAVKLKDSHAGAHHNLALTLKNLGKFNEAIKSHEMALKYEPDNLAHIYYLSELKKDILDLDLKKKILKILEDKVDQRRRNTNEVFGNYLLAMYERKSKNYEKELKHLIKGHHNYFQIRKRRFELGVKYSFDEVIQISKGAKTKNNDSKYDKIKPIFIIGVPRCGSTLVEKIIGSGKKIIPIGEETTVLENYINKKVLEKQSLNLGDVKIVREELNEIFKTKNLLSKKSDYIFTDKSLNNFFYLKLINGIYPNAKIINCNRNPLASIMSILQNNLTELAWTHDIKNIFKYFNNYFNIIENFNNSNPNKIYNLEIEKLSNYPEVESKKLMKYCELPWDKNCLEFYKRKDLISKTASNIQIRKGIFKHSLEKYLPYKNLLSKYGDKYSWFETT
mgnify:CR=1 FL=1